ncbi:MAG: RsmD family RNA methyltransferase [Leptospiraceae bacterium]|nr:RsmD family RNA methyltransferase [Leptospiraceae bacterium]MCK6379965.1 RsmD family RNA methyltransferase [Leptospiraceae bacterium]NUM40074.1 RsmD family RNA methyltransferase [Leptospiraceae bacterium]
MKTLRVQSGDYKGRIIPAITTNQNKENFTPSLLKKTIFSIIEDLHLKGNLEKAKTTFVDLFAGSGQMGIEAISRGFLKSVLFEIDQKRFTAFTRGIGLDYKEKVVLFRRDSFRYYKSALNDSEEFMVFFADPPYSFWDNNRSELKSLADSIISMKEKKSLLIFQSPMNPDWKNFESRKYGNHYLIIHSWLNSSV